MNKEIILRITHAKFKFTYVEEQIAEYFLGNNKPMSINDLSELLCVSPASITRFCKKIGLNNYKELIYLYKEHLKENDKINMNNISVDLQKSYFKIFNQIDESFNREKIEASYFKIFNQIDESFNREKIEAICDLIHSYRFMHIFALGLSATAAQDFKFRFSRMGKFIEVIYDKDAIDMATAVIEEGDLVFIFTLRGNKYLQKCAKALKEKGAKLVVITGNEHTKLNEYADIIIVTANLSGEESTGMISAQIPILIQIDLIHYYYVRKYKEVLDNT